jgi:hypothetical protein
MDLLAAPHSFLSLSLSTLTLVYDIERRRLHYHRQNHRTFATRKSGTGREEDGDTIGERDRHLHRGRDRMTCMVTSTSWWLSPMAVSISTISCDA